MKMTGRKGRVVAKNNGSFVYEPRSKDDVQLEVLNVAEKQRFMEGSKVIILAKRISCLQQTFLRSFVQILQTKFPDIVKNTE